MAALLTRNDGECHLESEPDSEGFYDYFRSTEQVRRVRTRDAPNGFCIIGHVLSERLRLA